MSGRVDVVKFSLLKSGLLKFVQPGGIAAKMLQKADEVEFVEENKVVSS